MVPHQCNQTCIPSGVAPNVPATPAVPVVPAPATPAALAAPTTGVTVWCSECSCQQIPSEVGEEFKIDDVSGTDSDKSKADGPDIQDATSNQVMSINNPLLLPVLARQGGEDIWHFFEKLPDKTVCKE